MTEKKIQSFTDLNAWKELQSQMLVARDINFLKEEDFKEIANQSIIVGKLLSGLIRTSKTYSSQIQIRDSKFNPYD